MNYLDIIIGILIILAAIHGYRKGFIHQLASLAALVLGIYLAVKFSQAIAPFIQSHFTSSQNTAKIISFLVIFIIVILLVHLLGKFLEKTFEEIELAPLNKIAGSIFSIAKAVFILSIILVLIRLTVISTSWPKTEDREKSYLYKPIESVAPFIFPYFKQSGESKNTQGPNAEQ